jgi:hypothetical protein
MFNFYLWKIKKSNLLFSSKFNYKHINLNFFSSDPTFLDQSVVHSGSCYGYGRPHVPPLNSKGLFGCTPQPTVPQSCMRQSIVSGLVGIHKLPRYMNKNNS